MPSGRGKIDGHRLDRPGRFDPRLRLGVRMKRNLRAGRAGKFVFDRGREQKIDELAGALWMRAILQDRQRVGDEQRAKLVRLPIRIDDRHGAGAFDFDDGVVCVGEAEGDLPSSAGLRDLLVACLLYTSPSPRDS